jgi:MraZ protein
MSFMGHDRTSVDSKRRIVIAAKFRRALDPAANETFVVTRGFDGCIAAYPQNAWQRRLAELEALDEKQPTARAYRRATLFHADEVKLDGQGRLLLPQSLCELARITEGSGALVVGGGSFLEIWNPEVHSAGASTEDSYEDNAVRVPRA